MLQDNDLGGFAMAESRQYITQIQENGNVMISEDVVASIVEHALAEVEGVACLSTKPGADIADLIGKNWGQGMKMVIAEDNSLTISCNVDFKRLFQMLLGAMRWQKFIVWLS